MEQEITVKIPRDWIEGLPMEELTLKKIVRLGIHQYKVDRALKLYCDGVGSLGYIAEQIGINKQELICAARNRNIVPESSDLTINEELTEWR